MADIDWGALLPPFTPDQRGGKLDHFQIATMEWVQGEFLLLCGPNEVADQIRQSAGGFCGEARLDRETKKTFTHGIYFPNGVPTFITDLAELLQNCLSIPSPDQVDHAMALDWYNQPNDDGEIVKTEAGYWIWTTKYASHPEYNNSKHSRRQIITALVDFIARHPLFASASAIVTAPGHNADGQGFGEVLAREVANRAGIPFVESTSPGPRPAQKETPQDLSDIFTVASPLAGTIIVLDDVFHTGGSATGAAAAARRAGAATVLLLVVARTIRK
ncbi:hypothetical protein FB472_0042 [Rhodoglobus vestalii]|uniref:Uncharacterized protein n=1 Tax=Rhodoglobus vestalii TaxID=193384 RepID=A0A8H2K1T6_9MICO|nr:AAA family ATPase [Rhodoglobus vestalii]TQO18525.1 hypothetical protein FB472_0042 [Rhodoglobus vestalii]